MNPSSPSNGTQKDSRTRKRSRLSISCNHCRIRKLKCSRTQPCDSCHRTGDSSTCSYASRAIHQSSYNDNSFDQNTKEMLAARITKLETLLLSVASTDQSSKSTPAGTKGGSFEDQMVSHPETSANPETSHHQRKVSGIKDSDDVTRAFGIMKFDHVEDQIIYLGGSHWISIMSEVEELRNQLIENDELEVVAAKHGASLRDVQTPSSLLRGIAPLASREDILSHMPARNIVDSLVNRFFESYQTTMAFIHEPSFRIEYLNHWNDPTKTKIIWLGLLFAIMQRAKLSCEEAGDVPFWNEWNLSRPSFHEFKALTVQCLIASDYTNPTAYTVETLMLYLHLDSMTLSGRSIETPLILGITIRLAMRMGIHRNSNAHPGLTPFEDEMRRRLWGTILMFDTLHSFQLSLPPSIGQIDWDCSIPRNIHNNEFGPDSTELPPPRPLSEHTEVTYIILKTRLLLVLKEIMNLITYKEQLSVEDIHKCETALSEAHATVPPFLRVSLAEESVSVSATIQSHRIAFDRVYQLSRCMLYRKFLLRARTDLSIKQYRLFCVDAALKLLHHQTALFANFKPMFSPAAMKYYQLNHPTLDFFVAGMVIALDLYYGLKDVCTVASIPSPQPSEDFPTNVEMTAALQTSNQFWEMLKDDSVEAAKAYGIFSFILQKVGRSLLPAEIGLGGNAAGQGAFEPEMMFSNDAFGSPGTGLEFDWDNWNAYLGNDLDFETLLQWPPTG